MAFYYCYIYVQLLLYLRLILIRILLYDFITCNLQFAKYLLKKTSKIQVYNIENSCIIKEEPTMYVYLIHDLKIWIKYSNKSLM